MSGARCKTTEAIPAEVKESKTLLLCFIVMGENDSRDPIFKWYAINPVVKKNEQRGSPPLFSEMPEYTAEDWGSCALGSKLYAIGGLHVPNREHEQRIERSKKFLVCDISSDSKDWKLSDTPMSGPKINSQVAVVDGKIYVFGSSIGCDSIPAAIPWGEVYDPENDTWTKLPDIQDILVRTYPRFGEGKVGDKTDHDYQYDFLYASRLFVDEKKIYICFASDGTYSSTSGSSSVFFDTSTDQWSPACFPYELSGESSGRDLVMINENTLVAALDGGLLIYKVNSGVRSLKERLPDLENDTTTLSGRRFLFHLGNHKLCLVWASGSCIHCLNFQLSLKRSGKSWFANVVGHATYDAPGLVLVACEEVNIGKDKEGDLERATDVDRNMEVDDLNHEMESRVNVNMQDKRSQTKRGKVCRRISQAKD